MLKRRMDDIKELVRAYDSLRNINSEMVGKASDALLGCIREALDSLADLISEETEPYLPDYIDWEGNVAIWSDRESDYFYSKSFCLSDRALKRLPELLASVPEITSVGETLNIL